MSLGTGRGGTGAGRASAWLEQGAASASRLQGSAGCGLQGAAGENVVSSGQTLRVCRIGWRVRCWLK